MSLYQDKEVAHSPCVDASSTILVCVPVLNEATHIESVLAQLSAELPGDLLIRFVVCDGGSVDGTQEIVARLARTDNRVVLLHNPKRLQSAAVNMTVRTLGSGFDVLVRCDAHCVYPRGFIPKLIGSLGRTHADAVVVPMDSIGDTCVRRAIAWVSDTLVGSGGAAHRGGRRSGFVDHGHHAAFITKAFVRAGGYDETFSHNEDAELDCRQRALGARIFLDASIRIRYLPRGSLRDLWRQYFGYGFGRSRTVRRHPQSLRLRQCAPLAVAVSYLGILAVPWHPWLAICPGLHLVVLGATAIALALKHRSVCGLLAGPAALVMHTAYAWGFLSGVLSHREVLWRTHSAQPLVLK